MNYICDTAKECGSETCNYRLSLPEHARLMPQLGFMCVKAGHRVYPELIVPDGECSDPICSCHAGVEAPDDEWTYQFGQRDGGWQPPQTHTCYYCDHEGTDVNRIALVRQQFPGESPDEDEVYACDDAIACDERWQAKGGSGVDLVEQVREAIFAEFFREFSVPERGRWTMTLRQRNLIVNRATTSIMKLIELPF